MPLRDLLLIAVVVVCSVIALGRPAAGLLMFVVFGFLGPHSLTWTIGQTFRHSLLVGSSTIVGYIFSSESKKLPQQRECFLLFLLWGLFGLSTFFAIDPDKALDQFIKVSKILSMVVLSTILINSEHRLHMLLRAIGLTLGFHALKAGIFTLITGGKYIVYGPAYSFLEANNSIGLALAMNVSLLVYLLRIENHPSLRWIMRAMVVFSYPAVLFTYSRGAWLGLVIVTVLLLLNSKQKILGLAFGGIIAIAILPTLLEIIPERLADRYDTLINYAEDDSAQSRFWNWEFCKRVGLSRPLTGGGFDFYSQELYAKYYPEFIDRWGSQKVWSCHSIWFTIFGEHGFPGLVVWIGLIGCCFLSLRQIRAYGRVRPEMSRVVDFAKMLETALIVFLVVGTFLDSAYFDMFYYLVGVIIIMKEIMPNTVAVSL